MLLAVQPPGHDTRRVHPRSRLRLQTVAVAVYGVLRADEQVLLMRRAGSGYHDGELSLPAGHLDGGEDALAGLLRELREELTITLDYEYLDLVFLHRRPVDRHAIDRRTGQVQRAALGRPRPPPA